MPFRTHLSSPLETLPQRLQRKHYPEALGRDCPTCNAKAGEPCMPASLSIPHLLRCRDDTKGAA